MSEQMNFDPNAVEEHVYGEGEVQYKQHSKNFRKGYRILYFTVIMIVILSLVVIFEDKSEDRIRREAEKADKEDSHIVPKKDKDDDKKPDAKDDKDKEPADKGDDKKEDEDAAAEKKRKEEEQAKKE